MRRILFAFAFALVFFASAAFCQDYDGALKAAKREHKPVLLYFFSNSCYYCTLMDKDTLADRDVEGELKKDFIVLRIDVDKSSELDRLYRVSATPSSWFLDPSGRRIREIPGYVPAGTYRNILEYMKGRHYNDTDLRAYLNKASPRK